MSVTAMGRSAEVGHPAGFGEQTAPQMIVVETM